MDKACVYLAQKLLIKCNIRNIEIKKLADIGVRLIYLLFNKICAPFIEDPPILPSLEYELDVLRTILDCISCDFLNYDLSSRIKPEAIQAKDANALHFLLDVFDNLCDCLQPADSTDKTATGAVGGVKRPAVAPTHLRSKLNACGKKSTLYSPRTAYFRKGHFKASNKDRAEKSRCFTVKSDVLQTNDLKVLRRLGLSREDLNLLKFETLIHRTKFSALLNKLRSEHAKNEKDLKNRAAKLALHRAIRQHLHRVVDKKSETLTMKRAKLTYENSLKQRKRAKTLLTETSEDGSSDSDVSPEEYLELLRRLSNVDREAEKYLTAFVDRQNVGERDIADSVENFHKGRADQLQNK